MHVGSFLIGAVFATVLASVAAYALGFSVMAALGMGLLTAFLAQVLYLFWVAALARKEAKGAVNEPAPAQTAKAETKADRATSSQ